MTQEHKLPKDIALQLQQQLPHILPILVREQSVDNYIVAKQKEKVHWNPQTNVAGSEHTKSVSDGGLVADSEVAVANLFG